MGTPLEAAFRRRAHAPARALALLVLVLPGCATLSGGSPDAERPVEVQAERIRHREQLRAATEAEPTEPKPPTVEEHLRRADALRNEGAYAAALWGYLRAHELDPDHPEPIARMAGLHLRVEPARAESIFRELVEKHPDSVAAHTGLGLVLIGRERWGAARDALERAVAIGPESAAAHSALGVCLDQLGEHEAAREAYVRAQTLHPRFYEALNNLGVSYLSTGEFDAAAEVLREAARLQRRDPAVFNNLGVALGRMGRYDEALDAFREAGSEQAARNNLGFVSYLNGDYARAIEEYEQALLARGDQRLVVLRNLRVARRASEAGVASASDELP